MKKNWIIVLLTAASWSCNAQSVKIHKAWTFYTVSIPGRAMTDLNGNIINPQPVIDRFIYIETNYKSRPAIDTVFYNSTPFTGTIDSVADKKLTVGVNASTGRPIVITPKKGNHLWLVSLQPIGGETVARGQVKKIILKCKLGKTRLKQVLPGEVQLAAPDRY